MTSIHFRPMNFGKELLMISKLSQKENIIWNCIIYVEVITLILGRLEIVRILRLIQWLN
jgi:hypothetical protein